VQNHRGTAQPIREKTGGSTFKNPPGHSAWKLIDAAAAAACASAARRCRNALQFPDQHRHRDRHDIETLARPFARG